MVGAKSVHHALCACHNYRRIIETVRGVYRESDLSVTIQTLEGRTIFVDWHVTNIVTNVTLPYRPNLRALAEFVADVTSWAPGLFPGLKLLTWLKPRHLCQCKRRKKNKSCECNCRALVFDTGKMIITGCETISQVSNDAERFSRFDP